MKNNRWILTPAALLLTLLLTVACQQSESPTDEPQVTQDPVKTESTQESIAAEEIWIPACRPGDLMTQ